MTLVILLSAVLLAVTVSAVPPSGSRDGRLRIIDVGENTLEALFYNADTGFRIRADSVSLTVISMSNDQVLLSGTRPHGSSFLTSVMGSSFLQYNITLETGEQRKVEFIVPESLVDQTKNAFEAAKVERMISQLNQDETEARTARESAFQRLFKQPEIALLESAAIALGNAGIMGYENQGALNFYGVAKALLTAQNRDETEENEPEGNMDVEEDEEDNEEDSTSGFKGLLGYTLCWDSHYNTATTCREGNCPQGPDCVGRCGPLCKCWWFVCLNCCYNQGCYDHDMCCGKHGYVSNECLMPIPFSCSEYSC